jgi:hypothetical protein
MLLPEGNALEAAAAEELAILPVKHLAEVVGFLNGSQTMAPVRIDREEIWNAQIAEVMDFEEVKGQEHTKRGLEVAAAGGHNVLTLYGIYFLGCRALPPLLTFAFSSNDFGETATSTLVEANEKGPEYVVVITGARKSPCFYRLEK